MKRSVCMATYNGGKYIEEQLSSILPELDTEDEIIIVDDGSSDNTMELIRSMADSRIKLFENDKNQGHNATFEKAISLSTGDVIFISDQDDIWIKGRVQLMTKALMSENVMLVSSNIVCFGNSGSYEKYESKLKAKNSKNHFRNLIDIFLGRNYFGCAMAFKKELTSVILPFPFYIESYDLWIATVANLIKSSIHIDDLTLHRRIHENNVSLRNRKLWQKFWSRVIFMYSVSVSLKRITFRNINYNENDEHLPNLHQLCHGHHRSQNQIQ